MGLTIINWYKMKVNKEFKIAFCSIIIFGLICHIYKFTNYLPNHDSLLNYYSSQNVVGSGRWLLSLACGVTSYYDLPWLNGLWSLILIAVTMICIIFLFEVKNPFVIVISSGLLVCAPSITETFFFEYTADGYMVAMLMATLACVLSKIETFSIRNYIMTCLLICCTCGIYQAYVSFAIVLMSLYCIWHIILKDLSIKQYIVWMIRQVVMLGISLGLYYLIWRICLIVENASVSTYQGMDKMTFDFSVIISGIARMIWTLASYFWGINVLKYGWTTYSVINTFLRKH